MGRCDTLKCVQNTGSEPKELMSYASISVAALAFVLLSSPHGRVMAQPPQPSFKAIWEPVNFKSDVKLFDVRFTDEQTGWAVGGASELAG